MVDSVDGGPIGPVFTLIPSDESASHFCSWLEIALMKHREVVSNAHRISFYSWPCFALLRLHSVTELYVGMGDWEVGFAWADCGPAPPVIDSIGVPSSTTSLSYGIPNVSPISIINHQQQLFSDHHVMYLFGTKWMPAIVNIRFCGSIELKSEAEETKLRLRDVVSCSRVQSLRPHTFTIAFRNKRSFVLAAADDYEASNIMQAVLLLSQQDCSKGSETGGVTKNVNRTGLHLCCVTVTDSGEVITAEFPPPGRSTYMRLEGVSRVYASPPHRIVLEVDLLEATGWWSNGDWMLHFISSEGMEHFLDSIRAIRPDLSVVSMSAKLLNAFDSKTSLISKQFDDLLLAL